MKLLFSILFLFIILNVSAQNDVKKDTSVYRIKAKLIKAEGLTPGCGIFAWAIAQKFDVIESNIPELKKGTIYIIEPCPEFLGKDFFKQNSIYAISVSRNNDAPLTI